MTNYEIVIDEDGRGHITVNEDGNLYTVSSDSPNFALHMDAALRGGSLDEVRNAAPDVTPLTELSERVFVNENVIEFDGEPVHDSLSRTIQRYWMEGRPYGGLVRFMERLSLNTCEHSRQALFDWVHDRDLEIDNEGFLIAYKGVQSDQTSVNAGWALVDDVRVDGHVPNQEGSVISMPRSEVEHDPAIGCSTGLHVGTKNYAQGWGQVLLTVRIDPVDVVSVPTDCNFQKMRVCRYKVIDIHDPQRQYEPTSADQPGFESVEERLNEAVGTESQHFIRSMLDKIRSKRN